MYGKSPSITTDLNTYKIKVHSVNSSNFIATTIGFYEISTIYFRMFSYLVTYLQAVSNIQVRIYLYLISEGRRNCSTL